MLNSRTFRGGSDNLAEFNDQFRNGKINKEKISKEELAAVIAFYDAGISYTDDHIGNLLKALDKLELSDNTIVIVTSDHGEEFLEHSQFRHEQYYNEVIEVPLIMRWPKKLPSHREINYSVQSINIAPTLLGLIGIPPVEQFQGKDLLPHIFEESVANNLVCYGGDDIEDASNAEYIIVNNKKLILNKGQRTNFAYIKDQGIEFYNLNENLEELQDDAINEKEEIELLISVLENYAKECQMLAKDVTDQDILDLDKSTLERLKALGYIK